MDEQQNQNITPDQQPPVTPVTQAQSSMFSKPVIGILVGILFLVAFSAFAKYQSWWPFLTENKKVSENTNTKTEEVVVPVTCSGETLKPTEDTTAWTNYDNKNLGLNLRYPKGWFVQSAPSSNHVNISYYDLDRNDNPNPPRSNNGSDKWEIFATTVYDNSENLTAEGFADGNRNISQAGVRKTICVDGRAALLIKQNDVFLGATDEDTASYIILAIGDKIYNFYSEFSDKHFETIASTIHITGIKEPSTDVSNWQIYSNEDYGFKFNYPDNWTYEELGDADEGAGIDTAEDDKSIFRLDFHYSAASELNTGRVVLEIVPPNSQFSRPNLQEFMQYLETSRGEGLQIINQQKAGVSGAEEAIAADESYQGNVYYHVVAIKKSGYIYVFSIPRPTPKTTEYFNKILSTLKFRN